MRKNIIYIYYFFKIICAFVHTDTYASLACKLLIFGRSHPASHTQTPLRYHTSESTYARTEQRDKSKSSCQPRKLKTKIRANKNLPLSPFPRRLLPYSPLNQTNYSSNDYHLPIASSVLLVRFFALYIHISIYLSLSLSTHTHTYIYIHTHIYIHMYMCMCIHTFTSALNLHTEQVTLSASTRSSPASP